MATCPATSILEPTGSKPGKNQTQATITPAAASAGFRLPMYRLKQGPNNRRITNVYIASKYRICSSTKQYAILMRPPKWRLIMTPATFTPTTPKVQINPKSALPLASSKDPEGCMMQRSKPTTERG